MTRRQTRRMIRWEAAAVAMFGAVLGIATGLVFGWGSVTAIPDTYLSVVSVPTIRLIIMVVVAAVARLVAALLPARRAGRLDVLDAIAMG
jgi:putative ABC transport system permease protein